MTNNKTDCRNSEEQHTVARHEFFMRRALQLARQALGDTHPNPLVGAVIVEDDTIVAEGFHKKAGEPHAEPAALRALGRKPGPGATLYVTLEPCCTHGRTPPCTSAIISAGITKVVIGATDPNPAHAGHGFQVLRQAGVQVIQGVLEEDCTDLNLIFNHAISTGDPLFALKIATTLDGRTATRSGESQWITGESSRAEVMRLRRLYPAIAVGSGTVLADNPRLTSRLPLAEHCPLRIIIDRSGKLAEVKNLQVFNDEHKTRTVVALGEKAFNKVGNRLAERGIRTWALADGEDYQTFTSLRQKCRDEKITGVLFEPGERLAGALIGAQQVNYLYHFQSPLLLADSQAKGFAEGPPRPKLEMALRIQNLRRESFGEDLLTRGIPRYTPKN